MITAIELGQISAMHKQAKLDPALANALGLGGAGALVGGGLGAISGALRPAEDENGKSKGILRRMLGGGLSGASTGGLIGGSLGALGTELTRPLVSAGLRGRGAYLERTGQNLARTGKDLAAVEPKTVSDRLNNIAARTNNMAERTHNVTEYGLNELARLGYNSSSRAQQHGMNSKLMPGLYDNPLSRAANQVADYLSPDNIASRIGKQTANATPSKSK